MKDVQLRKIVRQEITKRLDKLQTEEKDPFVPTYGKGDVVHDCPKHVQEIKTGLYGKVKGHTLNEAGDVNFVDVDFGTGKVFKHIPTKKLKILEMHVHVHETTPEPITGAGDDEVVTEEGTKCECTSVHPGISHRAYASQQLAEDLKIKSKKDKEIGSSLGYRLTQPQHKKMLALLNKNSSNPHVKKLLATLKDKYSDSVSISLDNRPFFVYASYGMLRIGSGGQVSQWNDTMKTALAKYIGEGFMQKPINLNKSVSLLEIFAPRKRKRLQEALSSSDIKQATEAIKAYVKKLGRRANGEIEVVAGNIAKILRWDDTKRKQLTSYLYKINKGSGEIIFGEGKSTKGKKRLTEAFASKKLAAVFGKVDKYSAERDFLKGMARQYGFEWDKITDAQVKGPDKNLDRKGVDLIIATKDTVLPSSSTYDWQTQIKKGQLLSATIKGKRVWSGRLSKIGTGGGRDRSFVGLDKRGYGNVRSVLAIDGAVVYHIDPAQKSRGATEKIASRKQAQEGATALMDAKRVKEENRAKYEAVLKVRAGAEGRGYLIKMIEQATRMFEKVLKEKLDMFRKGMITADNWSNDSWRTVNRNYEDMTRSFQYWMQAAASKEADVKKRPDDPGAAGYYDKEMSGYALKIKQDFNKMKNELSKIDKSKEYVKVQGRGY